MCDSFWRPSSIDTYVEIVFWFVFRVLKVNAFVVFFGDLLLSMHSVEIVSRVCPKGQYTYASPCGGLLLSVLPPDRQALDLPTLAP